MVAIDLLILIIYTAVEGSKGNLTAVRIRNAEHLESVETVRHCLITLEMFPDCDPLPDCDVQIVM